MAARGGIRKKEGEKLDDANISKVIELLNREENPISKKEACELLAISYNSTRLAKILDDYSQRIAFISERKKAIRNKPIELSDKRFIVESYLSGNSLTDISDTVFRSINVVKNILRAYNVPLRAGSIDYFHPIDIEEFSDSYNCGDLVYSARYGTVAEIKKEVISKNSLSKCYLIWLFGKEMQYAYQPAHELADLTKIQKELNITISTGYSREDILYSLNDAIRRKKKVNDE